MLWALEHQDKMRKLMAMLMSELLGETCQKSWRQIIQQYKQMGYFVSRRFTSLMNGTCGKKQQRQGGVKQVTQCCHQSPPTSWWLMLQFKAMLSTYQDLSASLKFCLIHQSLWSVLIISTDLVEKAYLTSCVLWSRDLALVSDTPTSKLELSLHHVLAPRS